MDKKQKDNQSDRHHCCMGRWERASQYKKQGEIPTHKASAGVAEGGLLVRGLVEIVQKFEA